MNAMSMKALLGALVLTLGTAGCATESTSVRTMSQPEGDQTPVASYPVPKTDPKGTAFVMSLGRESLASPSGAQALYLHLRLAAENKTDVGAWTLNAHEQTVSWGGPSAMPTYAQGSAGGSVVTVAPGQHGYLDLFFALPAGNVPPQAVLSWQVRRGNEVVADATPFALQSAQTPDYAYYQPVGVTVSYWPVHWWGVGFYGPWWWGPGWGAYPTWGGSYRHHHGGYYPGFHGGYGSGFRGGYSPGFRGGFGPGSVSPGGHGGGFRAAPPPAPPRGFGGGSGGFRAPRR